MNNNDEFEKLFKEESNMTDEFNHFNKQVKKSISQNIYKRIFKFMLVLAVVITAGYHGLSFILDQKHFNPAKIEGITFNEEEHAEQEKFHVLMESYLSLFVPGETYQYFYNNDYQKGFGSYELTALIYDSFEHNKVETLRSGNISINRSKLWIKYTGVSIESNEFFDYEKEKPDLTYLTPIYKYYEEITMMPQSAVLDVSISFKERISLEEYMKLREKYPQMITNYLAVNKVNHGLIGFTPQYIYGYDFSDEFNQQYPGLGYTSIKDTKYYEQRYHSLLQLMIDHKDFFAMTYGIAGGQELNLIEIKEEQQRIETEGVDLIGLRLFIQRDDLIDILDSGEVRVMHINNAKFSQYQK